MAMRVYWSVARGCNRSALEIFDAFSTDARKEYIDWITGSESKAPRNRRLGQAVEGMAEGKQRHWKYQK